MLFKTILTNLSIVILFHKKYATNWWVGGWMDGWTDGWT